MHAYQTLPDGRQPAGGDDFPQVIRPQAGRIWHRRGDLQPLRVAQIRPAHPIAVTLACRLLSAHLRMRVGLPVTQSVLLAEEMENA